MVLFRAVLTVLGFAFFVQVVVVSLGGPCLMTGTIACIFKKTE